MLSRLRHSNCLECGMPYGDPAFTYHAGRIESGPAYWSERGLLCSHPCAVEHFKRRREAGDPMREPAPYPLEQAGTGRD